MNKIKGKALSLVLSLALVISSFSAVPASAATRTLKGSLDGLGTDEFYFVNGENETTKKLDVDASFGTEVSGTPVLSTERHKQADTPKITAVSHKSGDHLVKVFDNSDTSKESNIDKDTEISNIALRLRNASVSGKEVLSVLYAASYTDENDNEYTVKASQDVTIRVYDKGEVVIGKTGTAVGKKGEYDDSFAQKTVAQMIETGNSDNVNLKALVATKADGDLKVNWDDSLVTEAYDKTKADQQKNSAADYILKSSSDNLTLNDGSANDYTYGALTDGAVPSSNVGTTTYEVSGGTTPAANAPKVEAGTTAGKLKVSPAEDDTAPDWKYYYKVNADKAATTDTSVAAGDDVISLTPTDTKIAVTAFDSTGATEKGTTVVTVKATTTGAIDPDNYASFTQKDSTKNQELTVAKAANDTATPSKWTYSYKITNDKDHSVVTGTVKDADKITVPAGEKTYTIVVTAKDTTTGKTYDTTGKVVVTKAGDHATDDVNVSVKDKAGIGSITLTAYATDSLKADIDAKTSEVKSKGNVTQKTKIEKTILVNTPDFEKIGKQGTNTYVYTGSLDKDSEKNKTAVKVNGYEVKFQDGASVAVADKASVTKISGNASKVSVDDATVGDIKLSNKAEADVTVSAAKVGNIDFDDDNKGSVTVDSVKAVAGDITSATTVKVSGGKVGNITAKDVTITPDDDDYDVTVGDISASGLVTIDSGDSKGVTVGTIKATGDDAEIALSGDDVTVKAFDFDYYGAELKLDGFVGSIPAPKNADTLVDGATISTQQADDKVTVKGDADINSVTVADESQITFDGKLNVGNVDGAGKLVVGLGKMNVESDASDVKLVFSDATFKAGDVAYTSAHDTIDTDSFNNYGFTVKKSEGSKTDTFKIDSVNFTGLTIAPASAEIAKGMSQTFTASAYAPGTKIPEGYHVQFTSEGSDSVFEVKDNQNGTATVTVVGYDTTFPSENRTTLKAELVDVDGATNDDYSAAEINITAIATPKVNYTSDTAVKAMKVGDTYRFRITSTNKVQPSFAVASDAATVTFRGNSGYDFFYDVKATKVGSYGVYVAGTKLAVLNITNAFSIDTKTVSVNAGASYQFKVTGATQPTLAVAGIGNIKLASKSGNDYFFKVAVPTNLAKGGHGVYVNGVVLSVLTVK